MYELNVTKFIRRGGSLSELSTPITCKYVLIQIHSKFGMWGDFFNVTCTGLNARNQPRACLAELGLTHAKGSQIQIPPLSSLLGPLSHSPHLKYKDKQQKNFIRNQNLFPSRMNLKIYMEWQTDPVKLEVNFLTDTVDIGDFNIQ